MNDFQLIALGAFMQAAAHYVYAGPTGWYAFWMISATTTAILSWLYRQQRSTQV